MSAKRVLPPWERFLNQSQSLRKRVSELLQAAQHIAHDEEGDVLNAEAVLRRESAEWDALASRVLAEMSRCAKGMEPLRNRYAEEFSDRLKRLLTEGGRSVYGESSLLVVDGLVYVDLDVRNSRVGINGVTQRDLSLKGLTEAILSDLQRVRQAMTPPNDFGVQLLRAYKAVILLAGGQFGSQVTTLELLPHVLMQRQHGRFLADPLARQFREYPLSEYRADLYGLIGAGNLRIDGATFHWSSGSNTKGAIFMFVPALGRTAHVGRIWFEHEGGPA
jgi:hypothetical protein